MGESLQEQFYGIVDGYYQFSDSFRLIDQVLGEVDHLHKLGILEGKSLGRMVNIINNQGRDRIARD